MRAVKTFMLVFLTAIFLVGCATTQQPQYITDIRNQYIVMDPPKELYSRVARIKPPYSKAYVDASYEEKEEILIKFIKQQERQIDNLITDRVLIDKWVKEETLRIEQLKKDFQ